jgi:hypothetical protein
MRLICPVESVRGWGDFEGLHMVANWYTFGSKPRTGKDDDCLWSGPWNRERLGDRDQYLMQ